MAEKVIGKYNVQWLRTEYNTAVLKARSAVQYKEALKTKALYPNLEYLQSDSVDKRPEHLAFVGTILPIEHPWWEKHLPPLDWNCKCRVRPTDKAPTALPDGSLKDEPKDGLANNPGKSGSLFDLHKHPYTKGQGLPTYPECRRQGLVKGAKLADDTSKLCPMHKLAKEQNKQKEDFKETQKDLLATLRGREVQYAEFNGRSARFVRNSITENLRYGELYPIKKEILYSLDKYFGLEYEYRFAKNVKPAKADNVHGYHIFTTKYIGNKRKTGGATV
ncbi:phage minor head protein [uncultured Porphyromonas sp.]|uniref:phage head morphogenesis protein n=1 Tax=uncultured Porphyromonas sp. TaxID=159274 RepID=UPI002617D16E|nr:phage minor head protein [uncultured Porphyromonas sp.]